MASSQKRENQGVNYSRKSLQRENQYTIYGIVYDDSLGLRSTAVVAEESEDNAISTLEKALVEDKGYETMKGDLNPAVVDTGFKCSRKGIIFGYDAFSNSPL